MRLDTAKDFDGGIPLAEAREAETAHLYRTRTMPPIMRSQEAGRVTVN